MLEVETGRCVAWWAMPTSTHATGRREVDVRGLRESFRGWGVDRVGLVVMERTGVFGPHARKSVWAWGRGVGRTEAFFELEGYAMEWVHPKVWKAVVLRGTKKDKQASIGFARYRWPEVVVKQDHDLADALCIAEWGRRVWGRKGVV